jgi:hypothetical protein
MIERPARFWAMIHEWSTPSPTAAKSSNEEELPALNKSQRTVVKRCRRRVLAPIRVIPGDAGKVDYPRLAHLSPRGAQRGHHEYRPEIVILRLRLAGKVSLAVVVVVVACFGSSEPRLWLPIGHRLLASDGDGQGYPTRV